MSKDHDQKVRRCHERLTQIITSAEKIKEATDYIDKQDSNVLADAYKSMSESEQKRWIKMNQFLENY